MIQTDALIIGAGPVGLFQAFQLGLQGFQSHIIDALPHIGGQCIELYPQKPIYDIPGIAVCTGQQLIEQLQTQIKPFTPTLHLSQEVTQIQKLDEERWLVQSCSTQDKSNDPSCVRSFATRTIFIAAGVGAFQTRKLNLENAALIEGTGLHYRLPTDDQHINFNGQSIWINGGEDQALEAALYLARLAKEVRPARITLIHRRDVFQAENHLIEQMRNAVKTGDIQLQIGQITSLTVQNNQLKTLQIISPDAQTIEEPAHQLFAFLGVSPKLGPVTQWGLEMARKQLIVNTEDFGTSEPGIYAVGDINTYPGKKKLILCGFHEATLAAFGAVKRLAPDRPQLLQYTTTSSELHKRLGVAGNA
jgi:thioredoxin reductase (NADPH)